MTESPQPVDPNNPYGQPLSYGRPSYPGPESARPGSILVMSILAIIFGSLGVLCGGFGLIGQLMVLAMGGRNPFMTQLPANRMSVIAYGAFSVAVTLVLSAALLAGGIGGLKLRPWARRGMIVWSVVTLIWATLTLVIALVWLNPATADYLQKMQLQTNPRASTAVAPMMGPIQTASAVVRWLFTCILPVCFLFLWRSPKVVAAFEPQENQGFQR